MAKPVAFVVVSHSDLVARGVVEIAAEMAPDVHFAAAGGDPQGGIGTSFDAIEEAVAASLEVEGVEAVLLTADLGSAVMTAESVAEFADGDVRLAGGALVEGTVAGAVRAQVGAPVAEVAEAVRTAVGAAPTGGAGTDAGQPDAADASEGAATRAGVDGEESHGAPSDPSDPNLGQGTDGALSRRVEVINPQGLHARPAALLARTAAGFDAKVLVEGVDAASILALMGLATKQGDTVTVSATGAQAAEALEAVTRAIADGLGDA